MTKKLADEFSMDIPHVTSIELPLIVKNTDKAVKMLGGKETLRKAVSSTTYGEDKKTQLELRLRNDRFHHPIQSISNNKEKILLKISIPKKNLPENYDTTDLKKLMELNEAKGDSTTIQPIGIINKTFSFKSINDFQVTTKNNPMINDINENLINNHNFNTFKQMFGKNKFINNQDYKNPNNYLNIDHQLPPPAIFSGIRQVQDYQYVKNQSTETVKTETGELKVVSKKAIPKLYSKVLDVNSSITPMEPHPELVKNYQELSNSTDLVENSFNYDLLGCINWLKEIFDIKPIWLRKHLEDIVSDDHRRVLKQALPYVTYIYKNGPWRFCNIKLGVDPKNSQEYWIFQSEYFRVSSYNFRHTTSDSSERVVPNSVKLLHQFDYLPKTTLRKVKIDSKLIFRGDYIPNTVTYQVGDIIDDDVKSIIDTFKHKGEFFRDLDLKTDGWISRQAIETIRRVIKYKLQQLIKEEAVDREKIHKIINANYKEIDHDDEDEEGDLEPDGEFDDILPDDGDLAEDDAPEHHEPQDDDINAFGEGNNPMETDMPVEEREEYLMNKIKTMDSSMNEKLSKLTDFIKQESIM